MSDGEARLTRDVVAHVALLARLQLTDEELDTFTEQLTAVLDHAADVEALDLTGVEPTTHALPLSTCCAMTNLGPDSTVTRCWRWRPNMPKAASGCPASSVRTNDAPPSNSPLRSRSGRDHRSTRRRGSPRDHRRRRRHDPCVQPRARRRGPSRGRRRRCPGRPRRRSRPAHRRARRAEGQPLHPGHSDDVLVADSRGLEAALRRDGRPPARRRRRHRHRQDEPRRVRHGFVDRELGVRRRPATPATRPGYPEGRAVAVPPRSPPASLLSVSDPTPAAPSASPPRCVASSA